MDSAAVWSPTSINFDALSLNWKTASLRARRWVSGASDGNTGSGTGTGGRGCPSARAATTEPMVSRTTSAALISRTRISFDSVSLSWTTASARAATRSSGRSDGYSATVSFPSPGAPASAPRPLSFPSSARLLGGRQRTVTFLDGDLPWIGNLPPAGATFDIRAWLVRNITWFLKRHTLISNPVCFWKHRKPMIRQLHLLCQDVGL